MAVEWLIGVSINIVGATTTNLGTVLMKYHSAKRNNVGIWKRVGLGLFALGSILTFVSFSFAAQSLLAGISAIQFVTNLFFAHYLLGEDYTKYNTIGTLVLISAIVLLVVSSDKSDVTSDVDMFFSQYFFTQTHLFFIVGVLSGVAALAFGFWFRTGVLPFWLKSGASERQLVLELSLPRSRSPATKILTPCAFVCLSAMVGAQSVVSGKVLSLVVSRSITVGNFYELASVRSYVALGLWLGCAVFWVVHLSRAMRIFHGAFIIPLTQVCWTLWTMVSGGVVYGEFTDIAPWRISLFILGAVALFGGVALLAPVYGANKSVAGTSDLSVSVSRQQSALETGAAGRNGTGSQTNLQHQQSVTAQLTTASHPHGKLHKLMTCLSVDEMAASNDPKASPVFLHSQTIIFQESLDSAIPDPPFLRFRRWLRKRRANGRYRGMHAAGSFSSGSELVPNFQSRKPSLTTLAANTPPGASSSGPADQTDEAETASKLVSAEVLGNSRV